MKEKVQVFKQAVMDYHKEQGFSGEAPTDAREAAVKMDAGYI